MIPIPIELDKMRHLRFTWKAIVDLEKKEGKGYPYILLEGGINALILLLWAGLKTEDPTLTYDKTGDLIEGWMQDKPLSELEEVVLKALKEGGWAKEQPERKAGG
jgi:hypothetical protein